MVATIEPPKIRMSDNAVRMMQSRAPEILFEGPAGCCAGEVELWDPMAMVGRRFDELAAAGNRVWVQTLNGPVLADAPFCKGFEPLFRITFSDGRSTVVTANHQFLTRRGWAKLSSISEGEALLVSLSGGTSRPSGSHGDGQRSSQTGAGWMDRCSPSPRQCDPQPQGASYTGPASPPSLGGALGSSHGGLTVGVQASKSVHTRSCQPFAPPSTPDCWAQLGGTGQPGWPLVQCAAEATSSSSQPHGLSTTASAPPRKLQQSDHGFGDTPRHALQESSLQRISGCDEPSRKSAPSPRPLESCASGVNTGPGSLGALLESGAYSSFSHYRGQWVTVESIQWERDDFFFDLHVPGEEHYLADGAFSHNTGKTWSLAMYAILLCERYPGVHGLFVRQTRKSMNSSVLDLFEDILGHDSPVLSPRRMKSTRDFYTFPHARKVTKSGKVYEGESQIDLLGMDNPERVMSTQYDFMFFFEATEGSLRAWDLLSSRMRRGTIPWNFMVADCNPAHAAHWLNIRADERRKVSAELAAELGDRFDPNAPKMYRVCTKLKDNPKYWDYANDCWTPEGAAYNIILSGMSPTEQKRLMDGLWVSQHGQVYGDFHHDKHVIQGRLKQKTADNSWWLYPVQILDWKQKPVLEGDFAKRRIKWFGIGVDWGYLPDPGTAGLYAVDYEDRVFLVKEAYVTQKGMDWWADLIIGWQKEFDVRAIICDVSPERCAKLNDMLGGKLNDKGEPIAQAAKKGPGSILAGIEVMRFGLKDDETGEPRFRYLATAPQIEDQLLIDRRIPTGGVLEFSSYLYPPHQDDKTNKQLPLDMHNHAMDRDRYFLTYAWGNTHNGPRAPRNPELDHPLYISADIETPAQSRAALIREARANRY